VRKRGRKTVIPKDRQEERKRREEVWIAASPKKVVLLLKNLIPILIVSK
jgi:hypothetical protein